MTTLISELLSEELIVKAYRSGPNILLAMSLDKKALNNLAGFAILCVPPNQPAYYLNNRISFTSSVHKGTSVADRKWTPSNLAPFQKFRWIHSLSEEDIDGVYTYKIVAMYFSSKENLKAGPSTSITIDFQRNPCKSFRDFSVGFTRGYLSSQAYAEKFNNKPFSPKITSIDFNTASYQEQYKWLGGSARKLIFDFLEECLEDSSITIDLFAYDLDEPDLIRCLLKFGVRLRVILDNSHLHTKPGALEIEVAKRLMHSAGKQNVMRGHFKRFAHNKVIIQKRNGKAIKVLTGSANFSLRGLYVQANNVITFHNPEIANIYEEAFNTAFTNMKDFQHSPVASKWFNFSLKESPQVSLAFSPHVSYNLSLDPIAESINAAEKSIMFAMMELNSSGPVLNSLQSLANSQRIYSYGVTQHAEGLNLFKPGITTGEFAPFSYLHGKIPENFKEEWSGGVGQVMHNKFIVIDFNGENPIVYTEPSNFAGEGEVANGDNIIVIYNKELATIYAVEAIRLLRPLSLSVFYEKLFQYKTFTLKRTQKKMVAALLR